MRTEDASRLYWFYAMLQVWHASRSSLGNWWALLSCWCEWCVKCLENLARCSDSPH